MLLLLVYCENILAADETGLLRSVSLRLGAWCPCLFFKNL